MSDFFFSYKALTDVSYYKLDGVCLLRGRTASVV